MSEQTALLRLQEIDLELMRSKKVASELPQRAKVQAARAAAKKVASELTKIVGQRKDVEIELAELESSKKFLESKVTEVQTAVANGTYHDAQSFEAALSMLAKKLEKIGFDTDRYLEQLETVERAEKNARALADKIAAEEQAQTDSFKADMDTIKADVEKLAAERKEILEQISAANLKAYEAAKERFGGIAVETLVGNRPSVCRVALQPSSYTDIRRTGAQITTCPYCKRMLVVAQED